MSLLDELVSVGPFMKAAGRAQVRSMRALSLLSVTYVVCGLVYVGVGGPIGGLFAVIASASVLGSIYLVIASVVHVLRNPGVRENERVAWLVLALVMGFITLPVYWFSIAPRAKMRTV